MNENICPHAPTQLFWTFTNYLGRDTAHLTRPGHHAKRLRPQRLGPALSNATHSQTPRGPPATWLALTPRRARGSSRTSRLLNGVTTEVTHGASGEEAASIWWIGAVLGEVMGAAASHQSSRSTRRGFLSHHGPR